MRIVHQDNVAAFAGNHTYWFLPQQILPAVISITSAAVVDTSEKILAFNLALGRSPLGTASFSLGMADTSITINLPLRGPELEVS